MPGFVSGRRATLVASDGEEEGAMASMTRREALEANGGDGTLLEWVARFGTEGACERELLRRMYPGGFRCPACGHGRCV